MSKRLYFDCPIKAAYMAKEFGVKFICDQWIVKIEFDWIEEKIYVAPESEAIFQPKENDLGIDDYPSHYTYFNNEWDADDDLLAYDLRREKIKPNVKILMRDNKQFFSAKEEA